MPKQSGVAPALRLLHPGDNSSRLCMMLSQLLLSLCQFGAESSRCLFEPLEIMEASLVAGFRGDERAFERFDMVSDGCGESEGAPELLERRMLLK